LILSAERETTQFSLAEARWQWTCVNVGRGGDPKAHVSIGMLLRANITIERRLCPSQAQMAITLCATKACDVTGGGGIAVAASDGTIGHTSRTGK